MFDRAIIDTDRFMDLSMSSKALYFLLGMEADDEGFVSYKKVMRIHGGNEDDFKVLVVKGFLISFPSGVVVITDWNTNNWLDSRRLKPTEYQKEKALLGLTSQGKYVLSNGLASIEEYRGEEIVAEATEINKDSGKLTRVVKTNEYGEEIQQKKGKELTPRKSPFPVALRVLSKYRELCAKEFDNDPQKTPYFESWMAKYINTVMKNSGLTEAQLYDMLEDWFRVASDREMLDVTKAFSAKNINKFKSEL